MVWEKFKAMPGSATILVTGWMAIIYCGWLKISQNDLFVPPHERKPPPHVLLRDYLTEKFGGSADGPPAGDNKGK